MQNENNVINGDLENNILTGTTGNDTINGYEGNDTINGGTGSDILNGDDGDDTIIGGSTTVNEIDIINGGSGNDIINKSQSFTGDEVWGGLGDDQIYGSTGNDIYHYFLGDGNDRITENNSSTSYFDQLFLHNINPEDVQIYRKESNLTDIFIDIGNGQGSIVIVGYYGSASSLNYLDKITFDNGVEWLSNDIALKAQNYYGNEGNESFTVNAGLQHILDLKNGDDVVTNNSDNSIINGGNGNDSITNNGKNVTIHGDDGNDKIYLNTKTGTYGSGTVYGDAGDDTFSFNSSNGLNTSSNYTIIGGLGNDKIYMSKGTETIKYSIGDGNDVIYISGSDLNTQRDKLVFENITKDMITNSTLRLENKGKDIVFKFDDNNSITLSNYFGNASQLNNLHEFQFADGSISNEELKNLITQIAKTDSTNVYYDTVWDDIIYGSLGSDVMTIVNGGNDEIFGNDGDDVITGNAANQLIHGGNGVDKINSGNGFDIIYGDAGDDFISSVTDAANNGVQNDQMTGGLGNDTIYLFKGSSTIHYNLGDGNDTILLGNDAINDIDRIIFGNNINSNHVNISLLNRKDLVLTFIDGGTIKITDYFASRINLDKVDFFKFADGIEWSSQDIREKLTAIEGQMGQDVLYDTVWDDTINSYAGNDYIYSTSGSDIIKAGGGDDYISLKGTNGAIVDAGTGNDYLFIDLGTKNTTVMGGAGDDYFWIDGSNTTLVMSATNNGSDYLWAPNYTGNVTVRIDANMGDMVLTNLNGDIGTFSWGLNSEIRTGIFSIRVEHQYTFIFNDGETKNLNDIVNKVYGDENDNNLRLYPELTHITQIYGNGGNDVLLSNNNSSYSNADATYLDGGSGNDTLINKSIFKVEMQGGTGDDTFHSYISNGILNDTSGYDKAYLTLSSGTTYNNLKLTYSGDYVLVSDKTNGNTIEISKNIEEIILNNGAPGNTIQERSALIGNEINQVIELMAQYESDELADMGASEDPEIVKNYNAIRAQITKDIGTLWAI